MLCANWRDIKLADESGKAYSRQIRSHAVRVVSDCAPLAMFGSGLNGGSCEMGHLLLEAVRQVAGLGQSDANYNPQYPKSSQPKQGRARKFHISCLDSEPSYFEHTLIVFHFVQPAGSECK